MRHLTRGPTDAHVRHRGHYDTMNNYDNNNKSTYILANVWYIIFYLRNHMVLMHFFRITPFGFLWGVILDNLLHGVNRPQHGEKINKGKNLGKKAGLSLVLSSRLHLDER